MTEKETTSLAAKMLEFAELTGDALSKAVEVAGRIAPYDDNGTEGVIQALVGIGLGVSTLNTTLTIVLQELRLISGAIREHGGLEHIETLYGPRGI